MGQREKVYQGEMERWRGGQVVQSRQAEERIRAVLTFPGGWLVEEEREQDMTMEVEGEPADQERDAELISMRRLLIPRLVTLLDSLRELLVKIRESALAGMEKGRDAWGYAKP